MKKKAIEFYSEGFRLVGDVYAPDDATASDRRAGIVLCHGYTGVKDIYLPDNARVLVEAGYVVLTFDYKGWGDSEGSRSRLAPYSRVADVQAALTFIGTRREVDPDRLGIYGTSYGGATVVWTGAVDARVKCIVSVVGIGDGTRWMRSVRRPDEFHDLLDALGAGPREAHAGGQVGVRQARGDPAARSPVGGAGRRRAARQSGRGGHAFRSSTSPRRSSSRRSGSSTGSRRAPCSSSPPTTTASCRPRNRRQLYAQGGRAQEAGGAEGLRPLRGLSGAGVQRGHAGDAGLVPAVPAGPPRLEEKRDAQPTVRESADRARRGRRRRHGRHAAARAPADRLRRDVPEPAAASDKGLAYQPVSLANVGWVRQNFNANLDNLRLLDEQTAQDEIMLFRRVGGQTVVDPTNASLSRDPLALARIARATGLNIVMGAGYYVAAAHPADMDRRSEDSIVREIVARSDGGRRRHRRARRAHRRDRQHVAVDGEREEGACVRPSRPSGRPARR